MKDNTQILLIMFIATVCAAVGDALLSMGMKQVGQGQHAGLQFLWATLRNGYALGGTLLLTVFFGLYAHVLSRAELSYVLPITALNYVFAALIAKVFLHEAVSPMRWLGTFIIMVGVAVVIRAE
jgi:drug/metabolite transporter (DMT)-like permease